MISCPPKSQALSWISTPSLKPTMPIWQMLLTRERLNKILAGHTGQPIEKIQQDTERDNFMGVEAAIEYGLVDKALDKRL